ncbi:hypothetical protein CANARDRAFT_27574 [[Candida] arabinofermentans NRRL YB-2248]|uniref:Succinate dehydrogenase cytochrome b560 subunit n=1 Tax=[Candida] arabinofermentans NRRL YB-2248 TaxID=983967 RepID=A0A1E4T3L2_9ASCO|nr:hypothetical protein CANARDRAFT_27574 [[Candida] arabinofermentans NRRL YB-2248]
MLPARLTLNACRPGLRQSIKPLTAFRSKITVVSTTSAQEQEILVAQRKNRPDSPHLTIYEPQLTAILSSFHRITGVGLALGFYGLTCSFALTSLLGVPFDANTLLSVFVGLPSGLLVAGKALASFPFVFHTGNGFRHLLWDTGRELTIKGVYRTGYAVLAFTAVLGTYFTLC